MSEQTRGDAEKRTLCMQRNQALDSVAVVQGELAVMAKRVQDLEWANKSLQERLEALTSEGSGPKVRKPRAPKVAIPPAGVPDFLKKSNGADHAQA